MTFSALFRSTAVVVLAVSFAVPSGAQSIVGRGKTGPVPSPVTLDPAGLFQAKFVSVIKVRSDDCLWSPISNFQNTV